MRKINTALIISAMFIAAACVTINVYFPAAAAEKAAEQFVGEVLGEPREEGSLFQPLELLQDSLLLASTGVLDALVPSAHAQQAKIDINTPQINSIKARMAQRQRSTLNSLFDAGAVGFSNDGLLMIRDRAAVPLSERRSLESVVADENRDRKAVYREIAVANGHPEWEQDIRDTFAREWVKNARRGWYYQDSGGAWRQK
ncbi:YdbL family protein [Pseudomonadota bacterium]